MDRPKRARVSATPLAYLCLVAAIGCGSGEPDSRVVGSSQHAVECGGPTGPAPQCGQCMTAVWHCEQTDPTVYFLPNPDDPSTGGGGGFTPPGCVCGYQCTFSGSPDCDRSPSSGDPTCKLKTPTLQCDPRSCDPEHPDVVTYPETVGFYDARSTQWIPPECLQATGSNWDEKCRPAGDNGSITLERAVRAMGGQQWDLFCSGVGGRMWGDDYCEDGRLCNKPTGSNRLCIECNEDGQCILNSDIGPWSIGTSTTAPAPPPSEEQAASVKPIPPAPPGAQTADPTTVPVAAGVGSAPGPRTDTPPPPTGGDKAGVVTTDTTADSVAPEWPHRIREFSPPEPVLPSQPPPNLNPPLWSKLTWFGSKPLVATRVPVNISLCDLLGPYPCPSWLLLDPATGNPFPRRPELPNDTYPGTPPGLDADEIEFEGDPVAVGSGQVEQTIVDLDVPARGGLHFKLERSYSSGVVTTGALGRNWAHNYEERLELVNEFTGSTYLPHYCFDALPTVRCLEHHAASGRSEVFVQDPATLLFVPSPGSFRTIRRISQELSRLLARRLVEVQRGDLDPAA